MTGTATSGGRNWTWVASIQDGVMSGEHTEIMGDGERYSSGTFQLTAQ